MLKQIKCWINLLRKKREVDSYGNLSWEEVKSFSIMSNGMYLSTSRAKIKHGWVISHTVYCIKNNSPKFRLSFSMGVLDDPNHKWVLSENKKD